ncbi:MAG: flavodoxin domain-containing protein [Aeromicrobium sp.]
MTSLRPRIVLVANASKQGATAEIAARLGHQLREALPRSSWLVQVEDTDALQTLDGYDAVVLGSAVYLGRWLKSARKLLDHTEVAPPNGLWLFSSGPASDGPHDPNLVPAAVKDAERLGARDNILFSGRMALEELGPVKRVLTSAMRVEGGDFRDWNVIDQWAEGIARELMGTAELREAQTVQEES